MNWPAWRYYCRLYKGSYHLLFFGIMGSLAQSAALFPILLLVRYGFDVLIPGKKVSLLILVGIAVFLLYAANIGLALLVRYIILKITKESIQLFRMELLKKFYAFSRSYYGKVDRSRLHSIVVQDTRRLDMMSNALIGQVLPAFLVCTALSVVLAVYNWFLFLLLFCLFPPTFFFSRTIGKRVKRSVKVSHQSFETFSKGVLFILQKMDFTRIQASEDYEMKRQLEYLRDECRSSSAMAWLQTLYSRGNNLVLASMGVIILIVGGSAVSSGTMTIGALLSFYVTVGLMRDHLNATFDVVPQIIEGAESLNTLYGLLRETDTTPYTGKKKIDFEGRIGISDVSFTYGERQILKNINLEISPGEIVAVIGGNGAGKSTLTYLILGFYLPQEGALYADGHPFTRLDMVHLRRQMGVVTQDPMMFDGTILQNITYGSPEVDLEQVIQAARLATADDFIRDLPDGYETLVGDNGVLLSGGQRQRISIARALLRRPKLLILDEPSNHIDSATVGRLMHNLKGMTPCPTTLIISHDREVVRHARHTYIIQEGMLREGDSPDIHPSGTGEETASALQTS